MRLYYAHKENYMLYFIPYNQLAKQGNNGRLYTIDSFIYINLMKKDRGRAAARPYTHKEKDNDHHGSILIYS